MKTLSNRSLSGSMARATQLAMIAGAAVFLSACASTPPPTADVALAGAAVNSASTAGGAELAPAEMRTARDKLDRAKLAMTAEKYDDALSLAQEAQVDAQLAEAKSRSAKSRKAADELQESIRVLREELNRKSK